jgi:hypothetical protein
VVNGVMLLTKCAQRLEEFLGDAGRVAVRLGGSPDIIQIKPEERVHIAKE